MTPGAADFRRITNLLAAEKVDYVLVGGFAAMIEGAPISTLDVDIVHARTNDNVARLLRALEAQEAVYRDPGGRRISPSAPNLLGPGHHLLFGTCGPIDVLGAIGNGLAYSDLLPHSSELEDDGIRFWVLGLAMLIETKLQAGREKDLAVLPILRRTLALRTERGG